MQHIQNTRTQIVHHMHAKGPDSESVQLCQAAVNHTSVCKPQCYQQVNGAYGTHPYTSAQYKAAAAVLQGVGRTTGCKRVCSVATESMMYLLLMFSIRHQAVDIILQRNTPSPGPPCMGREYLPSNCGALSPGVRLSTSSRPGLTTRGAEMMLCRARSCTPNVLRATRPVEAASSDYRKLMLLILAKPPVQVDRISV